MKKILIIYYSNKGTTKKMAEKISRGVNSVDGVEAIIRTLPDIKNTYDNLNNSKKGLILKKNSEIIDLIKNNINNNDYLMIKGSNSTGLNKITNDIKTGKINAL